jgi:hypothetical protein
MKYLLQRSILSPGAAFLVRSPRRRQVPCVDLTCEKPTGRGRVLVRLGWEGEMRGFGLSRFATAFMSNSG